MTNTTVQEVNDVAAANGLVFHAEAGFTIAVAATGVAYMGLVTPPGQKIRILSRAYSSSEPILTVDLFEATWSAGAAARTLNRDLSASQTPPAQFFFGVTPGTLGSIITGLTIRAQTSGGSSFLPVVADNNALILKPNTSYVIRFTNGGGANAVIGASFDIRLANPSDYAALAGNAI